MKRSALAAASIAAVVVAVFAGRLADAQYTEPGPYAPPGPFAEASDGTTWMIAIEPKAEQELISAFGSGFRYTAMRNIYPEVRDGLAAFERANIQTAPLLYLQGGAYSADPSDPLVCEYWPFSGNGVDFCLADAKHENWFLHNRADPKARLGETVRGVFEVRAANIASRGYRREWLQNALRFVENRASSEPGDGFDGVFIDDISLYPGHGWAGRVAELSDEEYREAAVGFVRFVARGLAERGYLVVPNVSLDVADPVQRAAYKRLAAHVTAISREQFVRFSDGPLFSSPPAQNGNDWLRELRLFDHVLRLGVGYLAIAYGAAWDTEAQAYARATFLLGWNGRPGSALAYRTVDGSDPLALSTWRREVGVPVGPLKAPGEGRYRRIYSGGVVLLNAHPRRTTRVRIGGDYALVADCARSVRLTPTSARILTADKLTTAC